MISRTAQYALRILGYLVRDDVQLVRGEEIAEATDVPANYLSKILNQLRKNGVVSARRGWRGGFQMVASARERPLREIITIIDGDDGLGKDGCIYGFPECLGDNPCPMHEYWLRIRAVYDEMVSTLKVEDLAAHE